MSDLTEVFIIIAGGLLAGLILIMLSRVAERDAKLERMRREVEERKRSEANHEPIKSVVAIDMTKEKYRGDFQLHSVRRYRVAEQACKEPMGDRLVAAGAWLFFVACLLLFILNLKA